MEKDHFRNILVLAVLSFIALSTPAIKDALAGSSNQTNVQSQPAAVVESNVPTLSATAVDTTVCPTGYTCTPNPKLTITSVPLSGPYPAVISYRLALSGVDRVEMNLSANSGISNIPGFTAYVNGTRDNALGKTVLQTKGKTIVEWQVVFTNKTGKDVLIGVKAIGITAKKQVGGDGDALTIPGKPSGAWCPYGYTCTSNQAAVVSNMATTYSPKMSAPSGTTSQQFAFSFAVTANNNPIFISKNIGDVLMGTSTNKDIYISPMALSADGSAAADGPTYYYLAPGTTRTFTATYLAVSVPERVGTYLIAAINVGMSAADKSVVLSSAEISNGLKAVLFH